MNNTTIVTNGWEAHLKKIFFDCLVWDNKKHHFSAGSFFSRWYRESGASYFFLFQKNLSRTNIQFAELISLVKLHAHDKGTGKREDILHFFLVADFIRGLQAVADDLIKSATDKNQLCATFIALYGDVLHHAALLEVFFGSCSIFFPPHLDIKLFEICSESGYIHSCGKNIYARELSNTNAEKFKKDVLSHLKKLPPTDKVFFSVYAHEDFTKFDRAQASQLRGGLDDVKIYAEKYFIGNKPLVKVLSELMREAKGKLVLAQAGNFHDHSRQIKANKCTIGQTLWLIVDRALNNDGTVATDSQFLICYNQTIKNENPFHIFDENKPAWVAHTTIPHNLAGAMVNITRPIWSSGTIAIYDPFSGSGTIALEAVKFKDVAMLCNDKSPVAKQLLQDNIEFFGMPNSVLRKTVAELHMLSKDSDGFGFNPEKQYGADRLEWALRLFRKVTKQSSKAQWFDIPEDVVQALSGEVAFPEKLKFYICLRTKLRHSVAIERKNESWLKAYRQEAKTLHFQASELLKLRERKKLDSRGIFTVARGDYSELSTIGADFWHDLMKPGKIRVITGDATWPPEGEFDVIITDPPYGFNNEINTISLAELFSLALDALIGHLKPTGQLVVALPDRSYSGRQIPVFATKPWVTEQILAIAKKHEFEAIVPANIIPQVGNLFQAPFYWRSEKALTRAILHFQFRKRRPDKDRSP